MILPLLVTSRQPGAVQLTLGSVEGLSSCALCLTGLEAMIQASKLALAFAAQALAVATT